MTCEEPFRMCFKVGKYFSEGEGYRRAMKKILYEELPDDRCVELSFLFFSNTRMDCGTVSKYDAIDKVDEKCEQFKQLPSDLKRQIFDYWLQVLQPEMEMIMNAERFEGDKKIIEPEIEDGDYDDDLGFGRL
jgi:hypothetical protein